MFVHNSSRFLRALVVGIVTIVSLGVAGSAGSIPIDGRRLLHETMDLQSGAQFRLLHWSHPESPQHIPGLTFAEKMKFSVQRGRNRLASLSSGMSEGPFATINSTNATFVSPLSSIQGEYAMDISIGTPPQNFTTIADTGSDLVWVQCLPCSECDPQSINQTGPLFDPSKSSTYKNLSCTDPMCPPVLEYCTDNTCIFEYTYGAGQVGGDLAHEIVTVTTTTGTTERTHDFVFGCGESDGFGGSLLNEDGLVGLGRGPLSFTSQLGDLYGNKFSYCLVSFYDSSSKTSPLLFGNSSVPTVPTQFTPFVENPKKNSFGAGTFYYIGLKGLKVNGAALDINPDVFSIDSVGVGGVISDSGTPPTLLVTEAYSPLLTKIKSLVKYPTVADPGPYGFDLCYNITGAKSPIFPNVTMVFDGLSLDLPQDNVFLSEQGGTVACLAFADAGTSPNLSIFGNIQQQNFQVLYDRENNQYGFAKVQCDTLSP